MGVYLALADWLCSLPPFDDGASLMTVPDAQLRSTQGPCVFGRTSDGLVIVVGRGKHSAGSKPVIGPVIENVLHADLGISVTPDEYIAGRFLIPASELQKYLETSPEPQKLLD